MADEYPQHTKFAERQDEAQTIGEFIEFLAGKDLFDESEAEATIAEFFKIDFEAFEAETKAMLAG